MDTKPTYTTEQQEVKKQPNTALKVIVLIALIALLVIGILLPIKLVPNAVTSIKDGFNSLFKGTDKVTLSTSTSDIQSGNTFTLSWTGKHEDNGSYVLSYACADGVSLITSINTPNETIACDTSYYFSPSTNAIDIAIVSNVNRIVDVPLTLGFLANDSSDAKTIGTLTVMVTNNSATGTQSGTTATTTPSTIETPATSTPTTPVTESVTPVTPATTTPSTPSTPTVTRAHQISNPNGTADLSVRIIDVGYITDAGTYVSSPTVTGNMRAAIKFVVSNAGDKNTGAWSFTANLPTSAHPTYSALNQPNLGPQDGIVYTLGFDQINSTTDNLVTITVDPGNYIREVSESNNTASAHITNTGGTSNGGTAYGYPDLTIKNVQLGYMNNGQFVPSNTVNNGQRAAIRFDVKNIGTNASGSWRFTANLPTGDSNSFYSSGLQGSLAAGQTSTLTLGFDNIANAGYNTASITIDPNNEVNESNNNNNSTSLTFYRY